jgi:hypothetical protein
MNNNYNQSNKSGKVGWGIILVGIGAFLLLSNMGLVPSFGELIGAFWPMIIIFVALMFHVGFYSNKNRVGLLVPGGILLTIGIVCQSATLWNLWRFMWPGFILAPAVGLFELYIFGKRNKGLLIPIGILTGLSLIFFSMSFRSLGGMARYIVPAMLILIGIAVLAKDKKQQNGYAYHENHQSNEQQNYYDNSSDI